MSTVAAEPVDGATTVEAVAPPDALRADLALIADQVPAGSHVLDLGCGDGTLLHWLAVHRGVTGYGLENDPRNIEVGIRRGVNVLDQDLDEGLPLFDDDSFDFVILAQTLQAMRRPDRLLAEMLRLAPECVVTFPNFGHWACRLHLLRTGRMPIATHLPHHWYDTPNIHLCTIRDFESACADLGIAIADRMVMDSDLQSGWLSSRMPNLMGAIALYRLKRGS